MRLALVSLACSRATRGWMMRSSLRGFGLDCGRRWLPELAAIEGAVRIEDGLTERFDDLSPGRFARFDDLSSSQFVGIDDDRAALLEHLGDGAFAGGDAACEAN